MINHSPCAWQQKECCSWTDPPLSASYVHMCCIHQHFWHLSLHGLSYTWLHYPISGHWGTKGLLSHDNHDSCPKHWVLEYCLMCCTVVKEASHLRKLQHLSIFPCRKQSLGINQRPCSWHTVWQLRSQCWCLCTVLQKCLCLCLCKLAC